MGILVGRDTRVLVQGITGREGHYHCELMLEYGTKVVAGCTPGKGGLSVHGVPVFDTVQAGVEKEGADASVIFVPPRAAVDAIYEAAEAGIKLIVCISEGIPVLDSMTAIRRLKVLYPGTRLIGPNCPGIIAPGKTNIGILPGSVFKPGMVGVVSRSGTLTYQVASDMVLGGFGQSLVVGVGGDPFIGTRFVDVIKMFESDQDTEAICIIGEIGGSDEEEAAAYIQANVHKPVVAYVAGRTAPPGKTMGHAGAIVSASAGTAATKMQAFVQAGVDVARAPYEISNLLRRAM